MKPNLSIFFFPSHFQKSVYSRDVMLLYSTLFFPFFHGLIFLKFILLDSIICKLKGFFLTFSVYLNNLCCDPSSLIAKSLIPIGECIKYSELECVVCSQPDDLSSPVSSLLPPDHDQHGESEAEGDGWRAVGWPGAPAPACHPQRPQDRVPSVSPG